MKRFKLLAITLLILGAFGLILAGCEAVKQVAEDLEKDAEIAAKALSNYGYDYSNKLLPLESVTAANLEPSEYDQYLEVDSSPYYFGFNFDNDQLSYEGHDITITGNVYFGFGDKTDLQNGTYTIYIVEYGNNLDITVDGDTLSDVEIDLLFSLTISTSSTYTTISANIVGHVGEYTVDTNIDVSAPQI